jgi:hypothetical protein
MRTLTAVALALTALAFIAIGPVPRYIEELRIGGGFGEPVDGGADFGADGAIATDGAIEARGDIAAGAFDALDHRITLRAGAGRTAFLDLHEADDTHGGALWFDGALDKLRLGTRDGAAQPTAALDIARGSANLAANGHITASGRITAADGLSVGASVLGSGGSIGIKAPLYTGPNSGLRIVHNAAGANDFGYLFQAAGNDAFKISNGGTVTTVGHVLANGGDVIAGVEGTTRGVVAVSRGAGGTTPGAIKMVSPNGTPRYLFVDDDGTVRVHSTLPSGNSDGIIVGLQY